MAGFLGSVVSDLAGPLVGALIGHKGSGMVSECCGGALHGDGVTRYRNRLHLHSHCTGCGMYHLTEFDGPSSVKLVHHIADALRHPPGAVVKELPPLQMIKGGSVLSSLATTALKAAAPLALKGATAGGHKLLDFLAEKAKAKLGGAGVFPVREVKSARRFGNAVKDKMAPVDFGAGYKLEHPHHTKAHTKAHHATVHHTVHHHAAHATHHAKAKARGGAMGAPEVLMEWNEFRKANHGLSRAEMSAKWHQERDSVPKHRKAMGQGLSIF